MSYCAYVCIGIQVYVHTFIYVYVYMCTCKCKWERLWYMLTIGKPWYIDVCCIILPVFP